MDRDPFQYNRLLLEDSLKRYDQALKSIQKGSQILLERGEMELKYAKGLSEWSYKSRKIIEQEDFESCEAIRTMYMDSVLEAETLSKMHLDIFYALRDERSPFEKVYSINRLRESRIGRKIDCKKIVVDAKKAKEMKRSLQENESRWERIRDRYIKEMKQLSESRVTSDVARQAKIQSLAAEINATQEKIENARKRYNLASKRVKDYQKTQSQVFEEMYGDLEVVERDRLNCTIDAFKRLHKIFSTTESTEWRKALANRLSTLREHIDQADIEKVLSGWLEQKEDYVRQTLNHPTKSLMSILFDRNPALKRRHDDFGSDLGPSGNSHDHTPLRYCESLASRPDPLRIRPGQRKTNFEVLDSDRSIIEAFYSPHSSFECLVSPVPDKENTVKHVTVTGAMHPNPSQDSVSTIEGETSVLNAVLDKRSAPTSPIEFCAPEETVRRSPSPAILGIYDHRRTPSPVEHAHDIDAMKSEIQNDVSGMVDVKVKALQDFASQEPGTLPFTKGQIIKQKVAKNTDGFSYGWTRTSRFTAKKYGFYPSDYVTLHHKAS